MEKNLILKDNEVKVLINVITHECASLVIESDRAKEFKYDGWEAYNQERIEKFQTLNSIIMKLEELGIDFES